MSQGYAYRLRRVAEEALIEEGELPDFLAMKQADGAHQVRAASTVGRLLAEGPPSRELSPNGGEVVYRWPTMMPERFEQESWSAGPARHPFRAFLGSPLCCAWIGTLYDGRTCGKLASEHDPLASAPYRPEAPDA